MTPFRKTSFSVYLPDGTRCRGAYYPGRGRVVGVHIHGFRSSAAHHKARFFLDHAIARGHSWANFDLPCHGRSEGEFRDFLISNALTAVTEVLREFRGGRVVLFGVSLGAWLAMLAARQLASAGRTAPGIVGAVLVAPAFNLIPQYFDRLPAEALRRWQADGVREFTDEYDHKPYQLGYDLLEDARQHDILAPHPAYRFPIRIFHGERDEIVAPDISRRFRAASPASDIQITPIPNGDHTLSAHLPLIAAELDALFAAAEAESKPQPAAHKPAHKPTAGKPAPPPRPAMERAG